MKQRNLEKRLISLILLAVMVLSYIPITTQAVDAATDIKAIQKPTGLSIVEDYDDYFGDMWLENLDLPELVSVTLADNSVIDAPVVWDTSVLDFRKPGYYYLPGAVSLPVGVTNSQKLDVAITIQVREKTNLLTNGGFENGKTGWSIGSSSLNQGTPAAAGQYALQVRSSTSKYASYNVLYPTTAAATELGTKVAAEGAGQYYIGAQVLDYLKDGETAHTDIMQAYIYMGYKTDAAASSFSYMPIPETETLSAEEYRAVGGVFNLTGNEVVLSPRLYLKSATKFAGQWVLVDEFEFIPLKVALKAEPAVITGVKTQIQARFVTVNYDKYLGEDWKEALGLPKTVDVLTEKGSTVSVGVTWNYSELNVAKPGKYTLIGKLDEAGCPNPKGFIVKQNIYVRKAENLFTNPSFESGKNGWSIGSNSANNGTPAAVGDFALQLGSPKSEKSAYNMMFLSTAEQTALAERVAQMGVGQYYISAQVRDYLADNEQPHTDALQAYLKVNYKTDLKATSASPKGNTQTVTLSSDGYVTTGGVFEMSGEEVWLRPDLYLESETKFVSQWFLVDDMQFVPLNVLIPFGQEPTDITEIADVIPVRAVVQNYDKFVGEDWKEKLDLPSAVEVITSKGTRASVNVIWDYDALNIKKIGKYVLTGRLDASAYPNPDNLTVTQTIYVREAKNLFTNPSFESGLAGWSYSSTYETNGTPAAVGKYALWVRSSSSSSVTSYNALFPSQVYQTQLAEKIVEEGAGQYYIGAKVMDGLHPQETAHADVMQSYIRVIYKDDPEATSSTALGTTKTVTLSDKEYATVDGVFELSGNETWIRTDVYLKSSTKFTSQWVLVDDMQFVPLNVIVKQYEGQMEQIKTVIPERHIVQNYQNYIGESYTVADLQLPVTVDVSSTTGEIVTVGVKWDYSKLDLSKLGTYVLTGTLEDMKLANPEGLKVKQTIKVVSYQNMIFNGSFEDGTEGWQIGYGSFEAGLSTPKMHGSYSIAVNTRPRRNFTSDTTTKYQLTFIGGTTYRDMLCRSVLETGAGVYYYSAYAMADEKSPNLSFDARFLYTCASKGSTTQYAYGNESELSQTQFNQSSGLVTIPGDTTFVRMDIYIKGANTDAIAGKKIFLDHAELVPLNVEVSVMSDVIDCGTVVTPYVYAGTAFEDLGLETTVPVMIKTGDKIKLNIIWDKSTYDPYKVGEQTVKGTLDLEGKYTNPYNFTVSAKIVVRAKGDPLRQTIYFSATGDDANDGLSPDSPKKDITKIGTYMAQGYNVRLKRGDVWYLPKQSITINDALATERAPQVLGVYGDESQPIPQLNFLLAIEDSAWELVDEKRNVWAADVSSLAEYKDTRIHRTFVEGTPYWHNQRINYVTLKAGEVCDYDGKLYIRTEGETPKNVEVIPASGSIGNRISIKNAAYLTVENLDFRGGSSVKAFMHLAAPSKYLTVQHCSITYSSYYHIVADTGNEDIHYKLELAYNFLDPMLSVKEGGDSRKGFRNVAYIEGITLRQGLEEAWVHHNHLRNMSHSFITIEHLNADNNPSYTGAHNCVVEYNLCEGVNACYARGFILGGQTSQKVSSLSSYNIIRHNEFYDMDTASHLFGDHSAVYSNVFSYTHTRDDYKGEPMDGKGAQPWGIDTACYGGGSVPEHMIVFNNTFFDVGGGINIYDIYEATDHNLMANNLVINYTDDNMSFPGGIYDRTKYGQTYIMNNGFYSADLTDHIVVDNVPYTAEAANEKVFGCSGNLSGDPKFATADINIINQLGARQNFALSDESPYRYAGLAWDAEIWKQFPVWEKIQDDLTDLYGNPFLGESPSMGAVSYTQKITGVVASVGELTEIAARVGATYEMLDLPATVVVTTEDGREIVLPISWTDAGFDSSKVGTCTLTATVHNGPHTNLTINGKTASVTVNIKDRMEIVDVLTAFDTINVNVPYGTSLEDTIAKMIKTVEVMSEGRFKEELPITWTAKRYDGYAPGYYTFEAKISDDLITNSKELEMETDVRVLHELYRGGEILVNPDFIDGTSADPWYVGQGTGNFRVTQDEQYLLEGEPAAVIVTSDGRYGSIRQDVLGPMQELGDGKYLYRFWMRAYRPEEPITTSYATLGITGPGLDTLRLNPITNIDTEWVQFYRILDVKDVAVATAAGYHTSTGKAEEDKGKSFIIAGCSFVYLGKTEEEVEATLDSLDLVWNVIKGENTTEKNVTSDLTLPTNIGNGSQIVWSSSDESVISADGKVTMGRLQQTVTLTATITYNGIETIKKFALTVPRDPQLPVYSASVSGTQTVNVGDEFRVEISLNSENVTSFGAYRFTLSFATSALEFVSISDPNSTVTVDGGRIVISGNGTERSITDTITVTFRAKKTSVTDIRLVSAEIDKDPNAKVDNLPAMTIAEKAATIDVQKGNNDASANAGKDNSAVIWIVVGAAAAILIAGGVAAVIVIKKKKVLPSEE